MRQRCLHPNDIRFKNYGGRGIKICSEWDDFTVFQNWAISHGYSDVLTLDRKDNNGNYEPDNCRWATQLEQNNNRRDNRVATIDGVTDTLRGWSNRTGIPYTTLLGRHRKGIVDNRMIKERKAKKDERTCSTDYRGTEIRVNEG